MASSPGLDWFGAARRPFLLALLIFYRSLDFIAQTNVFIFLSSIIEFLFSISSDEHRGSYLWGKR